MREPPPAQGCLERRIGKGRAGGRDPLDPGGLRRSVGTSLPPTAPAHPGGESGEDAGRCPAPDPPGHPWDAGHPGSGGGYGHGGSSAGAAGSGPGAFRSGADSFSHGAKDPLIQRLIWPYARANLSRASITSLIFTLKYVNTLFSKCKDRYFLSFMCNKCGIF